MTFNDVDTLQVFSWLLNPGEIQRLQKLTDGIMTTSLLDSQPVLPAVKKQKTKRNAKELAEKEDEQKKMVINNYFA